MPFAAKKNNLHVVNHSEPGHEKEILLLLSLSFFTQGTVFASSHHAHEFCSCPLYEYSPYGIRAQLNASN